jgi:hypothetical protein
MSDLDQRLSALFRSIDTRADFDTRLFERLRLEAVKDAQERARQALQIEQLRYTAARSELSSWRRARESISRVVTLETIGIATLAVGVVASTWSLDQLREWTPLLFTALGLAVGLSPLLSSLVPRRS